MMIDFQAACQLWGEAVNTAVYLFQRSPNEGLKMTNDRDDNQAPYERTYEMLHGLANLPMMLTSTRYCIELLSPNLCRFRCYTIRHIPAVQRRDKFGPWSKPWLMVSYIHNSETLCMIWNPEFEMVKAHAGVVFDEERNAHMSCPHESNQIDIFGLPEDKYLAEKDTGDEPLRGQDSQPRQIGKRSTSHMHEAAEEEAENIAHSQCLRQEAQTAQRSAADAENLPHSWHLRREDQTARRSAARLKKTRKVLPASPAPPMASRITRSQGKASAEGLTASEATGDAYTYAEAMESPQRDHRNRAMEEESTLILHNNAFSDLNSREARQLQVKSIGSKWDYKTKYNSDWSTQYTARQVIKRYEQTELCETYAPVGKLTTFR
jgi:hypothetical protein